MKSNAFCLHKENGRQCYASVFKNGYCQNHQPKKWVNENYSVPKNWNSLKNYVLQRDNFVCYICAQYGADSVDHIVPKSEGGSNLTSNLKAVHQKVAPYCHQKKTQEESLRGRMQNKLKPYGKRK